MHWQHVRNRGRWYTDTTGCKRAAAATLPDSISTVHIDDDAKRALWILSSHHCCMPAVALAKAFAHFWRGSHAGGLIPVGIQAVLASRSACKQAEKVR